LFKSIFEYTVRGVLLESLRDTGRLGVDFLFIAPGKSAFPFGLFRRSSTSCGGIRANRAWMEKDFRP
jgi:hypothetical protein